MTTGIFRTLPASFIILALWTLAWTVTAAPAFDYDAFLKSIRVPPGFGRVTGASFTADEAVFESASGQQARARVHTGFLSSGQLR